ncbi:hypothetical protein [Roseomonas indoligenes]|uniref:DUF3617 family protein n=1 Tax=Roseomonas indoligenes TaxID=2820811 RepID=A0A940MW28_9PROT|nr:hypothetical protein [Pararoseomonas indoligenes]MBP0493101.1 hypothetical protein [Pararoseomonas indoligenes]
MRSTLPVLLAGLVLPLAALAQPTPPGTSHAVPAPGVAPGTRPGPVAELPRLVIGAPGRCELSTGGQAQPCSSGLIYVHHRDGAVLISVQSTPTSTIGFQGNSDTQPVREEYTLELNRMHTSVDGRTAAKTVRGTCQISMTADGRTWHRATCRATDGNGMVTVMNFTGDGRQVTVARPGEEGGQGGKPAPVPAPKG